MKNRIFSALMILGLLIAFSCETSPFAFDVDCAECYTVEPDSADLIIRLTINDENPFVPVVFYRNNVESGVIEWVDTFTTETAYLYSPVDEEYSIKAKYITSSGDTLIAIDGDKLKSTLVTDVCETDCWIIRGGVLDVRLQE